VLRAGANDLEDAENGELLELMHSREFWSPKSSDVQVFFLRQTALFQIECNCPCLPKARIYCEWVNSRGKEKLDDQAVESRSGYKETCHEVGEHC
jgi:hypothetical protein